MAEIWLFIARDNLAAADRLTDSLHATFKRIAQFPLLGEARPEFGESIRVVAHGSYGIYYCPEPDGVLIVRVVHGARDFKSLQ